MHMSGLKSCFRFFRAKNRIFCAAFAAALFSFVLIQNGFCQNANYRCDSGAHYEARLNIVDNEQLSQQEQDKIRLPSNLKLWWDLPVSDQSFRQSSEPLKVELHSLVEGAMRFSPRVLAISLTPEIRQTEIPEANATFDTVAFLESKFIKTSDPVGSTLTTGGAEIWRDNNVYTQAGLRKKNIIGGQWEVSQRMGYEDSNSIYFVPDWQSSAKLALTYTQPLLRGAGRAYNESVIVMANIDTQLGTDDFHADLQTHILDVIKAYWELYLARATYIQKKRLVDEAKILQDKLESRRDLDTSNNQIIRVRAAMKVREGNLLKMQAVVHNAEIKLISLVNDPALLTNGQLELVPADNPIHEYVDSSMRDSFQTAMQCRPEISKAMNEIRMASVRQNVACNELLPVLNLLLSTYVSGLEGYDTTTGWREYNLGDPSYTLGMQFEVPLGNRAAQARMRRRTLEVQQLTYQFHQAISDLYKELEIAVRDVATAYREMNARYASVQAATEEIQYLSDRWNLIPGEEQVAGIVMEDLLNAQERLSDAEFDFVNAEISYNIALGSLQKVTGMLLQYTQSMPSGRLPGESDSIRSTSPDERLRHRFLSRIRNRAAGKTTTSTDPNRLPAAPMPVSFNPNTRR